MINRGVLVESCLKKLRDQMISKCLYNLFLAVEQTHRISLAGFSNLVCCLHNIP